MVFVFHFHHQQQQQFWSGLFLFSVCCNCVLFYSFFWVKVIHTYILTNWSIRQKFSRKKNAMPVSNSHQDMHLWSVYYALKSPHSRNILRDQSIMIVTHTHFFWFIVAAVVVSSCLSPCDGIIFRKVAKWQSS